MATFAATTPSAPAKLKASSVPFPKLGLKLSYLLHEFPDLCGGRVELESKTTTEVNSCSRRKSPSPRSFLSATS